MDIGPDSIPEIRNNVTMRLLGGEAFIMNLETMNTVALNETGTFIWSRIDGSRAVAAIFEDVVAEYDVSLEEAESSTIKLIEQLANENLLIITTPDE